MEVAKKSDNPRSGKCFFPCLACHRNMQQKIPQFHRCVEGNPLVVLYQVYVFIFAKEYRIHKNTTDSLQILIFRWCLGGFSDELIIEFQGVSYFIASEIASNAFLQVQLPEDEIIWLRQVVKENCQTGTENSEIFPNL